MKMQYMGLALLVLAGCDGGGSSQGGDAAGLTNLAPDSGNTAGTPVTISGLANKGPFEEGSVVTMHQVGDAGQGAAYMTEGTMGQFVAQVVPGAAYKMEITGHYLSEHFGDRSNDEMTLAAIIEGEEGASANINLATHLATERILELMQSGMSVSEATAMAESELALALGPVMRAPANAMRFSTLAVMNGIQEVDNEEGNGWLLAMTSMVEQAAVMASQINGAEVTAEMVALCAQIAADLADDGMIDQALLQEMLDARAQINPDRIHRNLLEFDAAHRIAAMVAETGMGDEDAMQYRCNAFGDEILCANTATLPMGSRHGVMGQLSAMANTEQVSIALDQMVANMNQFIDSDGDGIVNMDDDDDDNDGIPDAEDDTPYGS